MRWGGRRQSGNIEDRRGQRPARGRGGFAIGGGTILLVLVGSVLLGQNPLTLLNMIGGMQSVSGPPTDNRPVSTSQPGDQLGKFASVVLADTEDTWKTLLPKMGRPYQDPRMVLFSGAVQSACGYTSSAVGPFYCPGDHKVYLDLQFFRELDRKLGAPGDFAQAYVIAHEVGHHIQNLLGIAKQVRSLQQRGSSSKANALSVRMELQADCFAGVWGHHAQRERNLIEPGDFEEGLRAAAAIGDDQLQRKSQGHVQPESWTHGSSQQRMTWLRRGMETGNPQSCDTFSAERL